MLILHRFSSFQRSYRQPVRQISASASREGKSTTHIPDALSGSFDAKFLRALVLAQGIFEAIAWIDRDANHVSVETSVMSSRQWLNTYLLQRSLPC